MNRRYKKPITSMVLAFLAIILVLSVGGPSANAQENEEPAPNFSLAPVDIEGSYFDLTLSPGETQQIQIEIRNSGTANGEALMYLANVSSRVNGGMAVGLAGEPVSGAALWVDFSEETLSLEADTSLTKTLTISVSDDAAPGEHLTSVVIQEAGEGEDTESPSGVMFKTVSRQALGILITVPGPVTAALEIGTAGYTTVADHSVITFQAENPGNVRLKTAGELIISANTGQEIARSAVEYSSIYAGTGAILEAPIDFLLEPGEYSVSLRLEDSSHGVRAESGSLALTVPVSASPETADPQNPAPVGEPAGETAVETQTAGIPTWVLLVVIPAAVVAGAVIAVAVVVAMRRRSKPSDTTQPAAAVAPRNVVTREDPPLAPVTRKPATIRQMMPPSQRADLRKRPSTAQGDFD